jgi:hypothetical protein
VLPSLSGPEDEEPTDDARSSFNLSISLSIGYQRRRAKLAGKWEASITSIGLLAGGIAVVVFVVYEIFSRLVAGQT